MTELALLPFVKSITPVGSRVTCDPAPRDTDRDWLVLIDAADENKLMEYLSADQWQIGGSLPDEENKTPAEQRFISFTKGIENVIVTSSEEFHRRFIAATSVAKMLNVLDKAQRVALFQAVLYANKVNPWSVDPWSAFKAEMAEWEHAE